MDITNCRVNISDEYKVICLCGSTKFKKSFEKINAILTLNITVVSCYILYFIAEYVDLGIHISGIMSLVSMGLYMAAFGKTQITADAKKFVHDFWKIYIFVA